ncbi:hypothetical protein C4K08_2104 [Pseudomonas chlororaphis subsp. aureofaciens]|nr:hypothetical protein C4K08_2104 [Pseudomonas chlororaphis subsp. aureofaciens]
MSLGWRWGVLALVLGAAVGARIAWVWQTEELTKQAGGMSGSSLRKTWRMGASVNRPQ